VEGGDKKVGDRTCKKAEESWPPRRCSFVMAINGTCEVYDISLLERMVNCRVVGNSETGDKTSFEDISPLKSASRQRLIGHCWRVSED